MVIVGTNTWYYLDEKLKSKRGWFEDPVVTNYTVQELSLLPNSCQEYQKVGIV